MIYKGTESNIDHYSCFWDNKKQVLNVCKPTQETQKDVDVLESQNITTNNLHQHPTELRALLMKRDVTDVYICGLALDVCVGTSCPAFPFGFCSLCFVMTFTLYTLDVGVFSLPRFAIGCHYFEKCPCLLFP